MRATLATAVATIVAGFVGVGGVGGVVAREKVSLVVGVVVATDLAAVGSVPGQSGTARDMAGIHTGQCSWS